MKAHRLAALALLSLSAALPAHANLVVDPGFESCTAGGQPGSPWVASASTVCGSFSHSGAWAAGFDASGQTLTQTIATTAGSSYVFSFWWLAISGSSFSASFDGQPVFAVPGGTGSYSLEQFVVTASLASTVISFTGDARVLIDDVSVAATAIPEPVPAVLLATALLGIGLVSQAQARRKR